VPGTDLAAYLLASDLAPRLVPGTDLAACLLASDLAPHLVPGTDLAACLLASDLAPRLVPGTDLVAPIWLPHRSGCLFLASTGSGRRPKLRWICYAPGAWHRFGRTVGGPLFASIDGLGSETQATVELLYRLPGVRGDWHRCGTPNA
jgi:hypothetical protein